MQSPHLDLHRVVIEHNSWVVIVPRGRNERTFSRWGFTASAAYASPVG